MAGEAVFGFATANRIVFGTGKLTEAVPAVKALGRRALVVMGKSVDVRNRSWICSWISSV